MLDFTAVRARQRSINEFAATLTRPQFQFYMEASIESFGNLLAFCGDDDITSVLPEHFGYTWSEHIGGDHPVTWSLGQVIAHIASVAEEYARAAAALARGTSYEGTEAHAAAPKTLTTVSECYARLRESRRTRSAYLALWPSTPVREPQAVPWLGAQPVNANGMFAWSLAHDDSHRRQLRQILFPRSAGRMVL